MTFKVDSDPRARKLSRQTLALLSLGFWGLGFLAILSLGFRVSGLGLSRVWGLGCWVPSFLERGDLGI